MKSCIGCKHLIASPGLCNATDEGPWVPEWNPLTGRSRLRNRHPDADGAFRPTVEKMRAPGASCGPEAVLYVPTWRRRLWLKITGAVAKADAG
jgi:hypothetical protein